MKAVAAALVLIAGAAVVLWYGNTLSSWVLGGLIGGLAALLLSIPISLTLFSFFSRRHDARIRAEAEEEKALAHMYDYAEVPARMVQPVYEYEYEEVEHYALPPADREEEGYRRARPSRNLPVPSQTRLPASQRGRLSASRQQSRDANVPMLYSKDASGRRTTSRRMNYPGFPGYEPASSSLTQHRTAALRVARQEAAQEYDDDAGDIPTRSRRSRFAPRSQYAMPEPRADNERSRYLSRSLEQPDVPQNRYRSRHTVDASPSQNGSSRSLPARGESTASRRASRRHDPNTEYLEEEHYRQTEGLPRQYQTGSMSRRPQPDRSSEGLEPLTDDLQRPLVRRAPYTYEDDPVRQEFSRQVDTPRVRRSSLYHLDQHHPDEEY